MDPSWEVKSEYAEMPELMAKLRRKWPVGVLMLWYPVLASGAERGMVARLDAMGGEAVRSEVRFRRRGRGMA